ncbi:MULTISPECIES: hypothetical protein [unclassified Kitasatospora]|uniref:hypothetical protein n=1 Tax=unclassified Kitasatospora TaxID=2633591 RepID=UPI00382C6DC3
MQTTERRLIPVVLAAGALLLAACSAGGSASSSSTTAPADDPASDHPDLNARHIAQILQSGYVPGLAGLHGAGIDYTSRTKPVQVSPCRLEVPEKSGSLTPTGGGQTGRPTVGLGVRYSALIREYTNGLQVRAYLLPPKPDAQKVFAELAAAARACETRTVTASGAKDTPVGTTARPTLGEGGEGLAVTSTADLTTAGASTPTYTQVIRYGINGRILVEALEVSRPWNAVYGEADAEEDTDTAMKAILPSFKGLPE